MLGMVLWFALAIDSSDNAPLLSLGLKRHYVFLLLLLNLCHLMKKKCSAGPLVLVGVKGRKMRDFEVKLAHC